MATFDLSAMIKEYQVYTCTKCELVFNIHESPPFFLKVSLLDTTSENAFENVLGGPSNTICPGCNSHIRDQKINEILE
jgi:rubredoxin